ncbi:MAG: phenylalanine--tRNA ligase subunit beta [Gemmatimonadetes bacterium]|nr:phenylalanine--tRNA ligase subunit beta [Gemmatimonadota bacterium]
MRVSYRWLEALLPEGALAELPPEELARRLTLQGMAVDEVRPAFAGFEGVVLGKVVEVVPHPGADTLRLCTVTAGGGERRRVVCGAPNVEEGAVYGYATVGSRLPGDRRIGRAEIRGVESEGMLCSAPELGLDALGSADGIWRVPGTGETDLGRDLREALDLDDTILDVDVTSNRGDAFSHLGIAREVGAMVGVAPSLPEIEVTEEGEAAGDRVTVRIEDPDGCPRYLARLVDRLQVGPAPGWMQARLLALGVRPVNAVVDATNWVMLETGQPLHPFDFAKVRGGEIVVRRAVEGESFVTLDGRTRTLGSETTMICDAEGPIAVGGVMGGLESEVADGTRSVLLESAWFDPARIGRTARRLGLVSEASARFARGVDPEIVDVALDRAAGWIARLGGGRLAPGRAGAEAVDRPEASTIELRLVRLEGLVGRPFSPEESRRALTRLGFEVEERDERTLAARVPSWRFDVGREVDLVEEVARVVGYDTVPETPLPTLPVAPSVRAEEAGLDRLAQASRAAGFDEARTPSFVSREVLGEATPVDRLVEIRNPISKAERFLRPFVFTTLGAAVAHNVARGADRVKLFEIGHAFLLGESGEAVDESRRLALAAAGQREPLHWSETDPPAYDFFDLKGDVEELVARAGGWRPEFAPADRSWLHPGRQAEIHGADDEPVGFCGELHPRIVEEWGVGRRLYVAELELAPFERPPVVGTYRDFAREPAVERDLALVVPDEDHAAEVVGAIREAGLESLAEVTVFDRYRGAQLPEGRYSLGVRLVFQAGRTLTDEEVDREVDRLIERLERERGWTLR